MSTFCSRVHCKEEKDMIVGTSTSCVHQLRLANRSSHRNIIRQDLGHFDNLLGNRRECGKEEQDIRQLVQHLRRKNIEILDDRRARCLRAAATSPAAAPPTSVLAALPEKVASVPVGRRASRGPSPPLPWAAHGGASLQPGPFGATAARDASASAGRRALAVPPPSPPSTSIINC